MHLPPFRVLEQVAFAYADATEPMQALFVRVTMNPGYGAEFHSNSFLNRGQQSGRKRMTQNQAGSICLDGNLRWESLSLWERFKGPQCVPQHNSCQGKRKPNRE